MNKTDLYRELAASGSFFIYDLDRLLEHAKSLEPSSAKLFYACKANPFRAILKTLHQANISFDVASEGELRQVLSLGVLGENIIMTGPAKSEALMNFALEHRVSAFVIESPAQLDLLQKLARDYSYEPNILLRLQLRWNDLGKSVLGGDQITQFGMDVNTIEALLPRINLPFLGFHVFQWSNILSEEMLGSIWTKAISACKNITSDFRVMDVGGGLGIPYGEEKPINWKRIQEIIDELKEAHQLPELWLEMGRYFTGSCGEYITSVVDVKRTYDKNFAVLQGGIQHLSRPALVHQAFPVQLLRASSASKECFSLHGPLCTSLDGLGEHFLPNDLEAGDVLVFKQAGAYGFTESMPLFLCHDWAGEAVIQNQALQIIRAPVPASFWMK